jgi:hypothetical protein
MLATTWFPPTGDALAVLLGVVSIGVAIAVTRFFASTSLSAYYDDLDPKLDVYGNFELNAHHRGLLDTSQPHSYAFTITLLNTGWFGIKFEQPIRVQFAEPQPLQVLRVALSDVEPSLELLGDTAHGELALKFDVLKRGEAAKVLVGGQRAVSPHDVMLRLDNEANLPRQIELLMRPGHLPIGGARIFGAFDLLYAALCLASVYLGIWLISAVIPAWVGLSWVTPFKIVGDVFIFIIFILIGGAAMIHQMRHAAYELITGRYLPGLVGSYAAEYYSRSSRIPPP